MVMPEPRDFDFGTESTEIRLRDGKKHTVSVVTDEAKYYAELRRFDDAMTGSTFKCGRTRSRSA